MNEPRVDADRILIILLGAIGDVTRALPLLTRLRRAYPDARITWAVEPLSAPLVQGHPALDDIIVFERQDGAPAFWRFLRRLRAVQADLCIDLQRHLKSGIASRFSGAPVRLGFDRDNSREGNWRFQTDHIEPQQHFSSKLQQFLAFGEWLALPTGPLEFGLELTSAEEQRVDELLGDLPRPFIAAFVGSSCESRLWFPDRTATVIDRAARQGIATAVLGGPGDVAFASEVEELAKAKVWNLAGRTTLRDLIGIFARAHAGFGPDCGPMHIAAAVGCPVVSLWGATSPARSVPSGSEAYSLLGQADCMPCYKKTCPIGRQCMQAIEPEAVARLLQVILSR